MCYSFIYDKTVNCSTVSVNCIPFAQSAYKNIYTNEIYTHITVTVIFSSTVIFTFTNKKNEEQKTDGEKFFMTYQTYCIHHTHICMDVGCLIL